MSRWKQTQDQRFWSKVDTTDECWIWQASKNPAGYGRFGEKDRGVVLAHRLAYEQIMGPIPDGLVLDHLCRVRDCVNPFHLEPVTRAENTRRGNGHTNGNERLTHCINGHEFTKENTRTTDRQRTCRACCRDRMNAANAEKRSA